MRLVGPGALALLLLFNVGCSVQDATQKEGSGEGLSGTVQIDGSSTVFPISQAVAEEFQKDHDGVNVVVGTSGTGGGFKKFIAGETDINDASRPIKESEIEACREKGIEYAELKVAIDGLSVIVHPDNDWCDALTVAQLKAIWEPGSQISKWNELDPSWPDAEIKLFGPDTDSGTFDYFTEAVCGEGGASRPDYTPSADDNVLVTGVSNDKHSLGYFGYAYYVANKDKLKIIAIADGDDVSQAVLPTDETIESGQYTPLSRPLFLYVNTASLKKPEVREFLKYYLEQGQELVGEVGYVKLSAAQLEQCTSTLDQAIESVSDAESSDDSKGDEEKTDK